MVRGKRMMDAFVKLAAAAAFAAMLGGLAPVDAQAARSKVTGVVNVNTATEAQLCMLPGIGKAKARAIVQHRSQSRFRSAGDLLKVKGIGKKLLDRIGPYVVFSGDTTIQVHKAKKRPRRSKKR